MRGQEKSAKREARSAICGVKKMDERMKELVAMGAAAAANCHPCVDHHLAKCDELGISREEVAEAVKVGLMVNHGAERAIRKKARELLGESMVEAA
jgi:AhpD family alkylhydroperoxidase